MTPYEARVAAGSQRFALPDGARLADALRAVDFLPAPSLLEMATRSAKTRAKALLLASGALMRPGPGPVAVWIGLVTQGVLLTFPGQLSVVACNQLRDGEAYAILIVGEEAQRLPHADALAYIHRHARKSSSLSNA